MSEFDKLMREGSTRKDVKQRIASTAKFWRNWRWAMLIGLVTVPIGIGVFILLIGAVWGLIYSNREWFG